LGPQQLLSVGQHHRRAGDLCPESGHQREE